MRWCLEYEKVLSNERVGESGVMRGLGIRKVYG